MKLTLKSVLKKINKLLGLSNVKPVAQPDSQTTFFGRLALLEGPALFQALRGISDVKERRAITAEVHRLKMNAYRKQAIFHQSSAAHLVDDVHMMFREDFDYVVSISTPFVVDVESFKSVNEDLHHHHGYEDAKWFPRLRRAHPDMKLEFDLLEAEHAALVSLESCIKNGSYEALVEFVAALNDHLNREEMMTVPYLMNGSGFL